LAQIYPSITECAEIRSTTNFTAARQVPVQARLLLLELCHSLLELMEADRSEFRLDIAIWSDCFRRLEEFRKEELAQAGLEIRNVNSYDCEKLRSEANKMDSTSLRNFSTAFAFAFFWIANSQFVRNIEKIFAISQFFEKKRKIIRFASQKIFFRFASQYFPKKFFSLSLCFAIFFSDILSPGSGLFN